MNLCFIICPLGDAGSETRRRADRLLEQVIRPVLQLEPLSYEVRRADTTRNPIITRGISRHILDAELVIADLSDHNPNVFYELGKRHAWGGRVILMTNDIKCIPFDLKDYRTIEFDIDDTSSFDTLRTELRETVHEVEQIPIQPPAGMSPERIVELTRATVLVDRQQGRREHYFLARDLASKPCKRMILLQRSSSLVLGPEQGWGAEETFYHAIMNQIDAGVEFFHIVSLEGIKRHLQRKQSFFPETKAALARLSHVKANDVDAVAIKSSAGSWYFHKLPEPGIDPDFKPDRQARTFLVELANGETEGVIVMDLGGMQSCFRLRGPKMAEFFNACYRFYEECEVLTWDDLGRIFPHH